MFFLEVLYRVVGIFGGTVAGLNGAAALFEKFQAYIKRRKAKTEKDPSVASKLADGSADDCLNNH